MITLSTGLVVGGIAAVAVLVAVLIVGGELVGRWRHRRHARGACWVSVLAPPEVDPHGAVMFWRTVAGLCLPTRWRDRLVGTPHVVFEYRFTPSGIELGIWVPGTVPAPLVASAIRAAWPGSHTHITPAHTHDPANPAAPSDPSGPPGSSELPGPFGELAELVGLVGPGGCAVAGGVLRLARPQALPIADDPPGDPVRGLLAAPGRLRAGQWARVQILARPVTAARMARTATSGRPRLGGGGSVPVRLLAALVSGLADLVAGVLAEAVSLGAPSSSRSTQRPATGTRPSSSSGLGSAGRTSGPGPQRVMDRAVDRAVAGKLAGHGGGFQIRVRYAAATPIPNDNTDCTDASGGPDGGHDDGPDGGRDGGGPDQGRRAERWSR